MPRTPLSRSLRQEEARPYVSAGSGPGVATHANSLAPAGASLEAHRHSAGCPETPGTQPSARDVHSPLSPFRRRPPGACLGAPICGRPPGDGWCAAHLAPAYALSSPRARPGAGRWRVGRWPGLAALPGRLPRACQAPLPPLPGHVPGAMTTDRAVASGRSPGVEQRLGGALCADR
jgi:hypothetical protein